jgi:hypothetical protein
MKGRGISIHIKKPAFPLVSMPRILVPSLCDCTWNKTDFQTQIRSRSRTCFGFPLQLNSCPPCNGLVG